MTAKYSAHSAVSAVLDTTLNSLGDGSNKITVTPLSNDDAAERLLFGNFQLSLATTSTRSGTIVDLYILPEIDDVFVSGGDTLDPEEGYVGSFKFDKTTNARAAEIRGVKLPNSNYHVLVANALGVSFAATGNTLKLEIDSYEDV